MFFFPKNLCASIECLDVHADFFSDFFKHFEMCFQTMGSYAPKLDFRYGI
jgi:hypothetical protein